MYAYAVLLMIGAGLLLGSLWGLLGVVLLLPLLAARALGEEVMLLEAARLSRIRRKSALPPIARCMATSRACDDAAERTEAISTPVPLICKIR
jgi:hypothetical protein